jgi:histidinol dehydrogenase
MSVMTVVKRRSRRGRKALQRLALRSRQVLDPRVERRARKIVEAVRDRGDAALLEAVARYDGVRARRVADLRLVAEPDGEQLPAGFVEGLERAVAAVERYHRHQVREGFRLEGEGVVLEERRTPLRRVGIYVPGGRAAYPSSVVMTVVPARLAGVEQIVVATPPGSFRDSAALRHTLARLEVEELWGMGGAQAVAALAFGTETIERVDKILGPGGPWVTMAKHLVTPVVAVDGFTGPSEVVILASPDADVELVAADLLAQAEHDPLAAAILVTTRRAHARAVAAEVDRQLAELPSARVARDSLRRFGYALVVDDREEGLEVVEELAPEHLQLVGEAAEELAEREIPAGAVFVGSSTPEVFGDYLAGPSHVLPTGGSARYASGLGVDDFVRRSHVVRCEPGAASRWAAAAVALAEAEGLPAHAASAVRRLR